jgi:hypothetical protein
MRVTGTCDREQPDLLGLSFEMDVRALLQIRVIAG